MAQNKKSFILYCDLIHTMEYLTLEEKGIIFTWILDYVNDKNPDNLVGLLQAVVEPIKQQMKRDLKKYEARADRARENGKNGGRPKNPEEPKETQSVILEPRKPDTVNDTVNVNVNDTDSVKKGLTQEFFNSESWIVGLCRAQRVDRTTVETYIGLYIEMLSDEELKKPLTQLRFMFTSWFGNQNKNMGTKNKKDTGFAKDQITL